MTYTTLNGTARRAPHKTDLATAAELDRLDWLARNLDAAVRIPLLGVRVGWDSILGLVPGVGDALAIGPGLYILFRAHQLGASRATLARMAANAGVDFLIGSIPLLGDLFDVGFKSNLRNVRLLRQHLDIPQGQGPNPLP